MMKKVEEFMATGVRNHPSLTSAMVQFVMVMSHKSASGNGQLQVTEMMNSFKEMQTEFSNGSVWCSEGSQGVEDEEHIPPRTSGQDHGKIVEKGWKLPN